MDARARKPAKCTNPRRIRVGFRLPGIVDDGLLTLPSADLRECPKMAGQRQSADEFDARVRAAQQTLALAARCQMRSWPLLLARDRS